MRLLVVWRAYIGSSFMGYDLLKLDVENLEYIEINASVNGHLKHPFAT